VFYADLSRAVGASGLTGEGCGVTLMKGT